MNLILFGPFENSIMRHADSWRMLWALPRQGADFYKCLKIGTEEMIPSYSQKSVRLAVLGYSSEYSLGNPITIML